MTENEIATQIVDAALKVHRALGPGLLETVYESALEYELRDRGLQVERQVPIAVRYERMRAETGFFADLLVEQKVLVEVKSVEYVSPVVYKSVLTCMRFAQVKLALVINFHETLLKDGIKRLVLGLEE
ncbi:MAG: hypothetical protein AMXMBFR61_19550 [Fimbriimonadales bacterium]